MHLKTQKIIQIAALLLLLITSLILLQTENGMYKPIAVLLGLLFELLIISLVLGLIVKIFNKKTTLLTNMSIVVLTTITSFAFYTLISNWRPTVEVVIPLNYDGDVKLIHSTLKYDSLNLNSYGIGYLSEQRSKSGYKLKFIKEDKEILSTTLQNYTSNKFEFYRNDTSNYTIRSISFKIPSKNNLSTNEFSINQLVELGAINLSNLKKD